MDTATMMGASIADSSSMISASNTGYADGAAVTLSFSGFNRGIVHATEGAFSGTSMSSDFSGSTQGTACTGTQSMLVRTSDGDPSVITWTAPSSSSSSVTLSFASASGYGQVTRQTVTLTKTEAPSNAPSNSPSNSPSNAPSNAPTSSPSNAPTEAPTAPPTEAPTAP